MNGVTAWQFIKKCMYSCKTHTQLNVCKKMIDVATDNHYISYGSEYWKNLYDMYYQRWEELNDIEDKEILERINAKDKDFKKSSRCTDTLLCN